MNKDSALATPEKDNVYGKLHYGTSFEFNLDNAPGTKRILSAHNNTVDPRHRFGEKDFNDYVKNMMKLVCFVDDVTNYKDLLYPNYLTYVNNSLYKIYETKNNLSDVLMLAESSFQKSQKRQIIQN